jgi:broad specificity phosphatase PhoE
VIASVRPISLPRSRSTSAERGSYDSRQALLIRHAETDLAGTFCGSSNPPINAAGKAQIAALLESLSEQRIDAVYSSDLKRAGMTAQPIADKFLTELHIVPALREIHFGEWESLTWREIEQYDPVIAQRWLDQFPKLPTPDGESISSFEARVLSAFGILAAIDQKAAIRLTAVISIVGLAVGILFAASQQRRKTTR